MNTVKIDRSAKCLQVVALIYAVQHIYFLMMTVSALRTISNFSDMSFSSSLGPVVTGVVVMIALAIGAVIVSRELRAGKGWAWIAGVSICLFTIPSFCLPASILGLLSLLDRDVREPYLATFEFKF